jgi:hypothetical protein
VPILTYNQPESLWVSNRLVYYGETLPSMIRSPIRPMSRGIGH